MLGNGLKVLRVSGFKGWRARPKDLRFRALRIASGHIALIWEFPKIRGSNLGGPHNKDYSILGSILGSPYFGKLPYHLVRNKPPSVQHPNRRQARERG